MTSWRDPILSHFSPEIAAVARLTIVADPDQLLMEKGIVEGIRKRGYEIITFDDHALFRYAYEQRFRQLWDCGRFTNLVVVLRAERSELDWLPYDLLQEAKRHSRLLSFSLAELFPNLQPHVVSELDRSDLDEVYSAQQVHQPGQLGSNATRAFLLRHVFRVAPELIKTPADLLRVLLQRHYSGRAVPASLDEYLMHVLESSGQWSGWPLKQILSSRGSFLDFLQERWPIFVERQVYPIRELRMPYGLRYSGPLDLPFGHDDVRVYLDNLFTEGLLAPTTRVDKSHVKGTWLEIGVGSNDADGKHERFSKLLMLLASELPKNGADHHQWLQAAQRWGELLALRWSLGAAPSTAEQHQIEEIHDRIENDFAEWLGAHYGALSSLSPLPRPVMVHQVPAFLAHAMSNAPGAKRALVIIDGLALDQWSVIRPELQLRDWSLDEGAIFGWVPTLTSVSRQSIFAANPPFFFARSIETTRHEERLWSRFWEDQGLKRDEIAYLCQKDQEDDSDFRERIRRYAENTRCKALAVVVGTIDQMLHGTVTGSDGLHSSVRHWAQRGSLANLIDLLVAGGFGVLVTADHGNVEGRGIGKPNVGVTVEQRGRRVHIFRDTLTRTNVAAKYPGTITWPDIGLPADYFPLIAPPRKAFISEGMRTVAHGGSCIEEVIVPFVEIGGPP